MSVFLGFFFLLGLPKWLSTFSPLNIWSIPAVYIWMKDFLALSVFPFSFPSQVFWIVVPTLHIHIYILIYIYIYIYVCVCVCVCHKQCCPFEFPNLAVVLKHNRRFINFIPFLMANRSLPFVPALMTWVFKRESLCNPNTNSFFLPKTPFPISLSSPLPLPLPQTPPSFFSNQIPA